MLIKILSLGFMLTILLLMLLIYQIQPTGHSPASSSETKIAQRHKELNGNSGEE